MRRLPPGWMTDSAMGGFGKEGDRRLEGTGGGAEFVLPGGDTVRLTVTGTRGEAGVPLLCCSFFVAFVCLSFVFQPVRMCICPGGGGSFGVSAMPEGGHRGGQAETNWVSEVLLVFTPSPPRWVLERTWEEERDPV